MSTARASASASFAACAGGSGLVGFPRRPRRRHFGVGHAQIDDQQAALDGSQPVFERPVLFGPLGLQAQRFDPPDNLALNITNSVEVDFRGFELPQGLALLDPVLLDPGGFLEQPAPVFGIDRQHGIDLALIDQRIGLAPDPRV